MSRLTHGRWTCIAALFVHGRVLAADGGNATTATSHELDLEQFLQMLFVGFAVSLLVWVIGALRHARSEFRAVGRR